VIDSAPVGVRRPGPAARALAQFLLLSAVGVVLFMFHGISLHLTPWSQAIVNGIVKYAYPPKGQNDTTVVLFREENLAELAESFPVSYARHAEVLEALAVYGPRAVFVDFAFIDARSPEDQAALGRAICDLNARGKVPVYLAAPAPSSNRDHGAPINARLLECAEVVNAQMDVERGVSGVLTYLHGSGTSAFRWTPAFAMYDARTRILKLPRLKPEDAQPMEIIWGNLASPLNESWMHCTSEGALHHLFNILRENPLAAKRTCPHTNTISVMHLLGPINEDVRAAIADKAVFYGGNFQMVGDRVISPVYDDLPGVYLHAMAYDNLVTFDSTYKRADHHGLSLSSVVNGLLLLFTVVLLLLVDKPPAFAKALLGQLAAVSPWIKWLALGAALLLIGIALPDEPRRGAAARAAAAGRGRGPAPGRHASAPARVPAAVPAGLRPRGRHPGGGQRDVPGGGYALRHRGGPPARGAPRLFHLQGARGAGRALRGHVGSARGSGGGELPASDQPGPPQYRGLRGFLRDRAASHAIHRRGDREVLRAAPRPSAARGVGGRPRAARRGGLVLHSMLSR
jgi:CHASE2 domain-containing sensor protein